ncbi:serine hydrolase-like protein [Linepithema humile]|uniref:serine hydrolase-like protein n=1 Tax=Linepithema humile TaxID=83485 RepID=UPI0006235681|nr:PREDICTED: serine hydrolase-like protein [Linepithema humile]XP_012222358.1 PREDICTED: serine hydrolase-like protein [Linepithema humile]XP_012222359.1 PREDICTED: serine hydrolase-like protein [Linepithema humile]XP_012222360.1 PREDICTED: serine hydrolase-like protein [Linepithema humile]
MAESEQSSEIKLTVPWGHVAAKTYGSPTGEPVLLLHGRMDNAGTFTRLIRHLPIGLFYYVCIDLPGHGRSSHFPSWMLLDIMTYVQTLRFILEALQWETCIFMGHSMGGQIGLIYSTFQPHRFKKIICFDGFLMELKNTPEIRKYFKNAFTLSIQFNSNIKPKSYTREEILRALTTLRVAALSPEAADAMFDRAVTEVNGRYIYNRDIRLKNYPFTFMNVELFNYFNRKISVPVYLFSASSGFATSSPNAFTAACDAIDPKMLHVINIEGNHDVHNNNPEKIAPILCKILNNEYSTSKL